MGYGEVERGRKAVGGGRAHTAVCTSRSILLTLEKADHAWEHQGILLFSGQYHAAKSFIAPGEPWGGGIHKLVLPAFAEFRHGTLSSSGGHSEFRPTSAAFFVFSRGALSRGEWAKSKLKYTTLLS